MRNTLEEANGHEEDDEEAGEEDNDEEEAEDNTFGIWHQDFEESLERLDASVMALAQQAKARHHALRGLKGSRAERKAFKARYDTIRADRQDAFGRLFEIRKSLTPKNW